MGVVAQLQAALAQQAALAVNGGSRVDLRGAKAEAGGPDHRLHVEVLLSAGPLQFKPVCLHRLHLGVAAQAYVTALQGAIRLFPVEGLGQRQQARALLDQIHDGAALELVGQFAGQLHAAGPSSHHGQPLQGASPFPQLADQALQALHIGQGSEAVAVLHHSGNTEAVGLGSGGQHQPAEGQLPACAGMDQAVVRVNAHDPVLQPGNPFARQQGVVARGDFPAAQFAAEQFIEQGQKQEAIVGIDQQNRWMLAPAGERQGCVEPAETASHNHHRGRYRRRRRLHHCFVVRCRQLRPNPNQQLMPRAMMT